MQRSFIVLVAALAVLTVCAQEDWGACTANGVAGQCIERSTCGGTSTPGLCPGPRNIQCCTALGDSCGGNCPRGNCAHGCPCGLDAVMVNITEICASYDGWSQEVCCALVFHTDWCAASAANASPAKNLGAMLRPCKATAQPRWYIISLRFRILMPFLRGRTSEFFKLTRPDLRLSFLC